jgi:aspartate carbamoyltransferase catalytic subunit
MAVMSMCIGTQNIAMQANGKTDGEPNG